jgi:hypothetical protein
MEPNSLNQSPKIDILDHLLGPEWKGSSLFSRDRGMNSVLPYLTGLAPASTAQEDNFNRPKPKIIRGRGWNNCARSTRRLVPSGIRAAPQ